MRIHLERGFDQETISRWQHDLVDHPLLTTQSLCDLALRIDPDFVRFHDGERRLGTNMGVMLRTDPTQARLRNVIANLHEAEAFVQIMNIGSDPAYRVLLDELLDGVLPFLPARDRRLLNRDAAAFLASPGSVTPFHLDHEQNFLCHIRGAKTFYVWDHRDRSVVTERALEIFYSDGKLVETSYRPERQATALAVELNPGDCVYMPMGSPHAARTGTDITVTFSLLMNTQRSFDVIETYRVNRLIRRLGLAPTEVGASSVRDTVKRHALGSVRMVHDLVRRRGERRLQWY
jgi:hypothetical protein